MFNSITRPARVSDRSTFQTVLPQRVYDLWESIKSDAVEVRIEYDEHSGVLSIALPSDDRGQRSFDFLPQQLLLDFNPAKPPEPPSWDPEETDSLAEIRGMVMYLQARAVGRGPRSETFCGKLLALMKAG